jgi:hypothetical protein
LIALEAASPPVSPGDFDFRDGEHHDLDEPNLSSQRDLV